MQKEGRKKQAVHCTLCIFVVHIYHTIHVLIVSPYNIHVQCMCVCTICMYMYMFIYYFFYFVRVCFWLGIYIFMVLSFPLFLFLSSPFLFLVCYKRELSCTYMYMYNICEVVLTVDVCFVQSHTKKKKTEILSGMIPVLGTCTCIYSKFCTCT